MKKIPPNLSYLKYFFDVVRTGSVSESAKCNCVSQSAVSQAIAKLEESIKHQLISHQPARCQVTEKGMQLFEGAKEIFQALQRIENTLLEEEGGTITFGCTHSFALGLLPKYLMLAKERFPKLQVNFRLGHYISIKEWLKKGVIDFGILLDNDDLSLFDSKVIARGHFHLYASQSCDDPSSLPFLLDSEERRETNLIKQSYREKYGKEMVVLMEISSWEVIAKLTETGLGIGLFPDYLAESRQSKLKVVLQDLDPIPYSIYALFSKSRPHNPSAIQFCQLFKSSNEDHLSFRT